MNNINIINSNNYFTMYNIDNKKRNCVLIMPGGGYRYTSPRESLPVAEVFNEYDFHCAVLNYREDIDTLLTPTKQACYAIDYLKKMDIVDNLIILGFSAGGHLTASCACFHKEFKEFTNFADLMVLCYPVITTNKKYIHQGSFNRLLTQEVNNPKWIKKMSLENNVKKNMIPTFIWHTATDKSVNVQNSIRMFESMIKKDNDVTLHIYPNGVHGLSLANEKTFDNDPTKLNEEVSNWIYMVINWINFKLKK